MNTTDQIIPSVEQWLPIPGYEGRYEVSDHGRVKSLLRQNKVGRNKTRKTSESILKQFSDRHGRKQLMLIDSNSTAKNHRPSVLVALAFIGQRPHRHHVCHNDGNPANNYASNLRYDTAKGNNGDKFRHGTLRYGNDHYMGKITSADALDIFHSMVPMPKLAELYSVSLTTIYDVKAGRTWAKVTGYTK